jgi:hypothetical protein
VTTLTGEKKVRRSTEDNHVVEITAAGLRMKMRRGSGMRTWFGPYPWSRLYVILAKAEADKIVADRRAKRKTRKLRRW